MSQVEKLYDEHLDLLRQRAEEEGVSFIHLLSALSEAYKNPALYLFISKSAGLEQIKSAERQLIEEYRFRFYEDVANAGLEIRDSVTDMIEKVIQRLASAAAKDAKRLRHARITTETQKKNLTLGRQKGTRTNKQRANSVKNLALRINNDLLKHPDTMRWSLVERANYIAEKLASSTVEVDGNTYTATMVNGKKYSASTIRTWITGT